MELTKRQHEILDYINAYIQENHYPPSIRDIAAHFSLASAGGVHKHLNNLKNKGFITFEKNISRSIHILDKFEGYSTSVGTTPDLRQTTGVIELPLMGKVAAGLPIQYFLENESIELPESMVRKPSESYVLQVQGDSMIDECICDGDFVIVERRDYADNGDMIIAMINYNEATLKRFYLEGDTVRLQPSNREMEPIYVDAREISIQGKVASVVRHYQN